MYSLGGGQTYAYADVDDGTKSLLMVSAALMWHITHSALVWSLCNVDFLYTPRWRVANTQDGFE